MLTFLKLGGSLITDKRENQHFRAEVMRRAAQEIAGALAAEPTLKLLIGHGSGSFGHVAAQKYGTVHGVQSADQWRGFAEVSIVARRLNVMVIEALHEAGLPIFGVQPSASVHCANGKIESMELTPIHAALEHGLIPVVHGDVAIDTLLGGTIISTEAIFGFLAEHLRPTRIMLIGEVEGVYDAHRRVIPCITPQTLPTITDALGDSHGPDVTGGMAAKVRDMVGLVERLPDLQVRIFGGTLPGQVESALLGRATPGTLICR